MVFIHAGLMAAGLAFITAGTCVAFFLRRHRWRIPAHRLLAGTGVLFALSGCIAAVYAVNISEGQHFSVLHARAGGFGIILLVMTVTAGIVVTRRGSSTARTIHRRLGGTSPVLYLFSMLSGIALIAGL